MYIWNRFLFSWVQYLIFKHLASWPLLSILFRCVRCCFLSVSQNEIWLKKKAQHTSNGAERVLNMSNSFITARITVRSSLRNIAVWNQSLYKEDMLHSMLLLRRWVWNTTHVNISARRKQAHRNREQTPGCHGSEGLGRRMGWRALQWADANWCMSNTVLACNAGKSVPRLFGVSDSIESPRNAGDRGLLRGSWEGNRQEGQGSPDGGSRLQVSDVFSLLSSRRKQTTSVRLFFSPSQYKIRASLVSQLVKNLPAVQETWGRSLGWKIPWRRERLSTPVFWPGEFYGLYSPRGRKGSDMTEKII